MDDMHDYQVKVDVLQEAIDKWQSKALAKIWIITQTPDYTEGGATLNESDIGTIAQCALELRDEIAKLKQVGIIGKGAQTAVIDEIDVTPDVETEETDPIKLALRTWYKDDQLVPHWEQVNQAVNQLAAEAGEISGMWAKHLYKPGYEMTREMVMDELGDNWYYTRILACLYNITIEELTEYNRKKLEGGHGWDESWLKVHGRLREQQEQYNRAAFPPDAEVYASWIAYEATRTPATSANGGYRWVESVKTPFSQWLLGDTGDTTRHIAAEDLPPGVMGWVDRWENKTRILAYNASMLVGQQWPRKLEGEELAERIASFSAYVKVVIGEKSSD